MKVKVKEHKISTFLSASALCFSVLAICLVLYGFDSFSTDQNYNNQQDTVCAYRIPGIPDSITYCGEVVPIHLHDVKESLLRELISNNYFHSQTIQVILRSGRYFPIIEKVLKENNVPDDIKYIAAAESAFLHATSPAKAVSFWQILEVTGKEYGLTINKEIDERYHLEKSTEFAAKYLTKAKEKYGNWTMATASYNRGMNGISRQINRQDENDYYNLLLTTETARYVYRVIALKLIIENPELYGFCITKNDIYKPYSTKKIKIDDRVESFAEFAKEHNTNYKVLKLLNPWLRENYLSNPSKKEYEIKVPKRNSGLIRK